MGSRTFISGFPLPNNRLYQELKILISGSGNQEFWLPLLRGQKWEAGSSSWLAESFRNTHRAKETERNLFVLVKVCCTNTKLSGTDQKFFLYRICHFKLISKSNMARFGTRCSEHLLLTTFDNLWVARR